MLNTLLKPFESYLPESNRLERIWKIGQVDFQKRYYNDRLGLLWALLNPLFQISIYYFVFTHVFHYDQENYALFLFAGLITWMFFSEGSNKGMVLLKSKKYLIENIQFNKLDLYISLVISVGIGFLFNLSIFILGCLISVSSIDWNWFVIPILLIIIVLNIISSSLILSVIHIFLKDINHLWSIVTLLGFWSSGIFFDAEGIKNNFHFLYFLNPFISVIANLRKIILYNEPPEWIYINYWLVTSIIILVLSIWFFNSTSHKALEKL